MLANNRYAIAVNGGGGKDQTVTFISTEVPIDTYPNKLVELGRLSVSTGTASPKHRGCYGVSMCNYAYVDVNRGGENPGAYISIGLYAESSVKTMIDGKEFIFYLYFKESPSFIWMEVNRDNDRMFFHTNLTVPTPMLGTSPGEPTNYLLLNQRPQGKCGGNMLIGPCSYESALYFSKVEPYLAVKLPGNLKTGKYEFKDIPVLRLYSQTRNFSASNAVDLTSYLKISGTITLPNRCFVSGAPSNINFSDIKNNANNGKLETKEFVVSTTCQGLNSKVRQYLTVSSDVQDYIKVFSKDDKGGKALGYAMQIVPQGRYGEPNCNVNSENLNKFNSEYLIRTISPGDKQNFTDKVKFSLCKYGIPASTYLGENNVSIKITSRWEN